MIQISHLTKRFGEKLAVDDLSFKVEPGMVTGFLGPNGAGKSTTMRTILGLDHLTSGAVTINGRRFADLPVPMREVGALLEARAVHGSRTAYNHLRCLAQSNQIARQRVDEVLGLVGLDAVANKRARTFSLGMFQRLGIAAALLGDPAVLMFDEPVNGLDPEGIRWIRHLMRDLAREGRTVLVSSHLMSEMANTADHLVVIGRGRLIADTSVDRFVQSNGGKNVVVRTADGHELTQILSARGAEVHRSTEDTLVVTGIDSAEIGRLAAVRGIALAELTPQRISLEDAFMDLTRESVEYSVSKGAVR